MGIKHLWTILSPYAERKSLYTLEGKKVAVDLAGWVCESLNIVDYSVHPRFYLRTLFFRISHLLRLGVIPVFVLEGAAPTLKYDVIAKRNQLKFRGVKPREETETMEKADTVRNRFDFVLKQCEDLIHALGLKCVKGSGEAEAFCAFLNKKGIVDGVSSQDSDCFAYGARTVFRNFSISQQGALAAQGGNVDCYDLDTINKTSNIGRNKIVVLALLCGCDYCPGVDGIGKETVTKLFNQYSEEEILERIKSWRELDDYFTDIEMKVNNKNICVNCGHLGRIQAHTKNGCSFCNSHHGCDESLWKEQRIAIKAEILIRKKAMSDLDFPSKKVLHEFFQEPDSVDENLNLNWQQPRLVKFVKVCSNLLQWSEIYCFQKILPLLTRWQIQTTQKNLSQLTECIPPDFIRKKRSPKGIASYEIVWDKTCKIFDCLVPDSQIENFIKKNPGGLDDLYSTVEPADLIEKIYPELVQKYDLLHCKKRTIDWTPRKFKRARVINSSSLNPIKVSKKIKRMPKTSDQLKQQMLTNFFIKTVKSPMQQSPINISQFNLDDCDVEMSTCNRSLALDTLHSIKVSKKTTSIRKRSDGLKQQLISSFFTKTAKSSTLQYPMNISQFDLDDCDAETSTCNISLALDNILKASNEPKVFRGKRLIYDKFKFTTNRPRPILKHCTQNRLKVDSDFNLLNISLQSLSISKSCTKKQISLKRILYENNLQKNYELSESMNNNLGNDILNSSINDSY